MLLNLIITNFAIIDRLEVEFGPGFNVLTGETGAGKSIILDALGLLLGDRARPDLVRSGTKEASVEALFDIGQLPTVKAALASAGLPGATDSELVLRRIVQNEGRRRAYVNGALVTLVQLQPLAETLVSVCGQHEHQNLMQRKAHLAMLDHYGGGAELKHAYQESFRALQDTRRQLDQLSSAENERLRRLDLLQHQSDEIEAASLSPHEETGLLSERALLQNAERLAGVTQQGYDVLYGADGAVCEQLGRLVSALQGVGGIDAELGKLADNLNKSLIEIEDAAVQLRQYLGRLSFEPGRQDEVERRLALLTKLKTKYAPSITEILQLKAEYDAEIDLLKNAAETRESLQKEIAVLEAEVLKRGSKLSEVRQVSAAGLADAVERQLADLAMAGAQFKVALEALHEPGFEGLEEVEFLVSTNPGEPLMPLAKVVSGGELSRLMLAFKRVVPGADKIPTLVFDEVDAGVGGETATAVGRKLHAVSAASQVLCVTHLPQVAAFADRHYRVVKQESSGRTLAGLHQLSLEDRVKEMARMLGGANVTAQSLLHAREMIESCATDR